MVKKVKKIQEIDEKVLKSLKLYEKAYGEYDPTGYEVEYTRIPGGLIRTISTPEALDQLFIPLAASYFVVS